VSFRVFLLNHIAQQTLTLQGKEGSALNPFVPARIPVRKLSRTTQGAHIRKAAKQVKGGKPEESKRTEISCALGGRSLRCLVQAGWEAIGGMRVSGGGEKIIKHGDVYSRESAGGVLNGSPNGGADGDIGKETGEMDKGGSD